MAAKGTAMKVTTVRFGADLWRLLEAEAALAGVSVSQYIREAALARAAAAAAVRGEDPVTLLAGTTAKPDLEISDVQRAKRRENAAASTRRRATVTASETRATLAQAQQAVRRAHEVSSRSAEVLEHRRGR